MPPPSEPAAATCSSLAMRRYVAIPLRAIAGGGFVQHGWAKIQTGNMLRPQIFYRLIRRRSDREPVVSVHSVCLFCYQNGCCASDNSRRKLQRRQVQGCDVVRRSACMSRTWTWQMAESASAAVYGRVKRLPSRRGKATALSPSIRS